METKVGRKAKARDQFAELAVIEQETPFVEWFGFHYATAYAHGVKHRQEDRDVNLNELVKAHWGYVKGVLLVSKVSKQRIKAAGAAYFKGFVEGFKHGR